MHMALAHPTAILVIMDMGAVIMVDYQNVRYTFSKFCLKVSYLASGPVVGTIWDLKGKPGNNSAYMEVSKNRGVSKGSTGGTGGKHLDDDNDYYTKTSGHDSKHRRNPNSMFY